MVAVKCSNCKIKFNKFKHELQRTNKNFCSNKCLHEYRTKKVSVICANCETTFLKSYTQIKKTKNNFCCRRCANTYNNKLYPKRHKGKIRLNQCKICGINVYERKYCIQHMPKNKNKKRKQVKCKKCGKLTYNKIFCSMGCRTKHALIDKQVPCLCCGKMLYSKYFYRKYCNNTCKSKHIEKEYIQRWLNGKENGLSGNPKHGSISKLVKRYLIKTRGEKCERCGWSEVHPITHKVPIEVDHIDGNFLNNVPENLILLCPNCHALTPTYRALNMGRGREYRKVNQKTKK